MRIKKLIWATDGSSESERALDYAKYIAENADAQIVGVHIVPLPVKMLYENMSESKEEVKNWRLKIESAAANRFVEVKEECGKRGIVFDGVILNGVPSDKIKEVAKRKNADLIVMGKHGQGFIEHMLAGSETVKVLKNSHVPVLAVKGENNKTRFNNILVPIDLTHRSDSAVSYALEMAQLTGAKLTVIFVLRLDMYAQDIPAGALERVIEQAINTLNKRASQIKKIFESKKGTSKDIKIHTEVIHGMNEAVTITQYAAKNKIDLIVIHTHGRTGITRFLLGSVTERVVSSSKCSVLALRPE